MTMEKLNPADFRNIAFIKSGAIGDVLMTTPLLRAARRLFPHARITYVVGDWAAPVLEGNSDADEIIRLDTKKIFSSRLTQIRYFLSASRALRKRKYDLCFVLDKSWLAAKFAKMCGIPVRIGFDRGGEGKSLTRKVGYGPVRHEIDCYLDLLQFFGKPAKTKRELVFPVSNKNKTVAYRFIKQHKLQKRRLVGICPGGAQNPGQAMASRRWPAERFAAVTKQIANSKNAVVFFGGPSDQELIKNIKRMSEVKSYTFTGTLRETAAVMKKCAAVITNDSGLMHIASAAGCKVISIFGPTDPRRKAPLSRGSVYLWKPPEYDDSWDVYAKYPDKDLVSGVTVDDVLKAIGKLAR